jgi:hypothetical protein
MINRETSPRAGSFSLPVKTISMDIPAPMIQGFHDWWPAAAILVVVYFGLRFISRQSRGRPKLEGVSYDVHQITTTLACTDHQARTLLATYNGNAAKAINEIKTGRAVLPGSEFKELARYEGDVKSFRLEQATFGLLTRNDEKVFLDPDGEGLLVLGVVNPKGRADQHGLSRADRGKVYGQLFWKTEDGWLRFLMDSKRMDYVVLGDRKQNVAIRNFQLIVEDLVTNSKSLQVHESVQPFLSDLQAPLYRNLAELDAYSAKLLEEQA